MNKENKKYYTLGVKINNDTRDMLEMLAEAQGASVSVIVRHALIQYLNNKEVQENNTHYKYVNGKLLIKHIETF